MGIRGELFTTSVTVNKRSYFFNMKENRAGDIFLQIVESKSKDGEGFDRHAIVVFKDDMQEFLKGLDESLRAMEKQKSVRQRSVQRPQPALEKKRGFGAAQKSAEEKSSEKARRLRVVKKNP